MNTFNCPHCGKEISIQQSTATEPAYREVKRAAKVGEKIKIVDDRGDSDSKIGDIATVIAKWGFDGGIDCKTGDGRLLCVWHCRYVTLEPVLESPFSEPSPTEYYNGKVVCVKSANEGITAGRTYTIKDGCFTADNGWKYSGATRVKSIDDLNSILFSDFIEAKGEQS